LKDNKTFPISSRTVYRDSRFSIEQRIFSLEGKKENLRVGVVNFPVRKSVGILPVTQGGKVILERHYRYALAQDIWEIPAGWLKAGEKLLEGAKRELMEETGFSSSKMCSLGSIFPAAGYSTEEIFLFLARVRNSPEEKQRLELGEVIRLGYFSNSEIEKMIKSNRIKDAMTISAISRAKMRGLL
jgi:ADP-ribose pyrophosphatase